jgi:hypothetical protein
MAAFGILRVKADWEDDEPTYFHESAYLEYGDDLEKGTRVLIYAADAIVAEIEVLSDFTSVNPDTQRDMTDPLPPEERDTKTPTEDHLDRDEGLVFSMPDRNINTRAYQLPMRVVRSLAETRPIPRAAIVRAIGDSSVEDDLWTPIDKQIYQALVGEWEAEDS